MAPVISCDLCEKIDRAGRGIDLHNVGMDSKHLEICASCMGDILTVMNNLKGRESGK